MKLGILYTGGTIGCVGEPLAPLSETDFSTAFNELMTPVITAQYSDFDVEFIPFGSSLDSTNLQPSDWCKMATDVLANYSSYDGFLILHGTDTMAWTASALSFLLMGLDADGNPNAVLTKPVMVTGAQLPLFHQGSHPTDFSLLYNTDAFQNVCGAVAAIYTGIPNVCLYFDSKLLRGNRTLKTNASEFDAFSTPNFPVMGEYGVEFSLYNDYVLPGPVTSDVSLDSTSVQATLSDQLSYISDNINQQTVIPFLSYPAYYNTNASPNTSVLANMLNASLGLGVNGLILESYGEGNFPSGNPTTPADGAIYKALNTAHENGTVVVNCTQVVAGTVNSNAYAAGSWLASVGAIGAYDMTPIAALCKLFYVSTLASYSTYNWGQSTVEQLMQTNLTGEIMNVNVLDCRTNSTLFAGESISALDASALLINDASLGPVLKSSDGSVLWSALDIPSADDVPGRLVMQSDGNLVFYNSANTPIYASDTVQTSPATSKLVLAGSTQSTLSLYIDYYAENTVTKTLYSS